MSCTWTRKLWPKSSNKGFSLTQSVSEIVRIVYVYTIHIRVPTDFVLQGRRWLLNLILRHFDKECFSVLLSRFVCVCVQRLEKWYKKISNKQHGYQKTQSLMLILSPLKKLQEHSCEKIYQQKSERKLKFLTFITMCESFSPFTFWVNNCTLFSTDSIFSFYDIHIKFLKICLFNHFLLTLKPNLTKRLKKTKKHIS